MCLFDTPFFEQDNILLISTTEAQKNIIALGKDVLCLLILGKHAFADISLSISPCEQILN